MTFRYKKYLAFVQLQNIPDISDIPEKSEGQDISNEFLYHPCPSPCRNQYSPEDLEFLAQLSQSSAKNGIRRIAYINQADEEDYEKNKKEIKRNWLYKFYSDSDNPPERELLPNRGIELAVKEIDGKPRLEISYIINEDGNSVMMPRVVGFVKLGQSKKDAPESIKIKEFLCGIHAVAGRKKAKFLFIADAIY